MNRKEIVVLVDERPVKTPLGYTILQTCSNVGIEIPRFCYHDNLLIAGNCRICLVEIFGAKKLVASCAVHVSENMLIYTNTIRVRLARQNVLEFLLANHPLDCPICDQGGECDLQDITALFGADRGRFYEQEKRSVLNKDFGPLIRTSMNRCIHCTRCVRFLSISSGFSLLGTVGRGISTEISLYINQFIFDELSGNITDLCPVGALTSKPYSFKARPWEFVSLTSIDIFDSMNSWLIFDVMANKICRVLPYAHDALNECWLTNKARYAYDGLFVQRLNSCLIKISLSFFSSKIEINRTPILMKFTVFSKLSWGAAINTFLGVLLSRLTSSFCIFLGTSLDIESVLGARIFANSLGGGDLFFTPIGEHNQEIASKSLDFSFLYLFSTSLLNLSALPSFCLLLGTNLRFEVPLLNFRITKLVSSFNVSVYKIGGSSFYSAYKTTLISNNLLSFYNICEFKHIFCKNFYLNAFTYRPFLLVAPLALSQIGLADITFVAVDFMRRLLRVRPVNFSNIFQTSEFNFIGFVFQYSAQLQAVDLGLANGIVKLNTCDNRKLLGLSSTHTRVIYSMGLADNLVLRCNANSFLLFQGSHGHGLLTAANLILPSITYAEKVGTYRNLRGITKTANIVVDYNFGSKDDIAIFNDILLSLKNTGLFRFFTFAFKNGLFFNFSLLLFNEFFLNLDLKNFSITYNLLPVSSQLLAIYGSSSLNKFFYYTVVYSRPKFRLQSICTFFDEFVLRNLMLSKIFTNLLSSSVLNYYEGGSSLLLRASKTMSLCSNLFLKKNFSFASTYF